MLTVPLTGFTLSQPAGSRRTAYLGKSKEKKRKVRSFDHIHISISRIQFMVHVFDFFLNRQTRKKTFRTYSMKCFYILYV